MSCENRAPWPCPRTLAFDELLTQARERGEAVVFIPPYGWDLVPEPLPGRALTSYDQLDEDSPPR
jgi:hypothetical protein